MTVFNDTSRAQISGGYQASTRHGVSTVPPASTTSSCAFTMSGKQPIWCKQGQSQNTDLVFQIQLLSWDNENCYRILRTTPGLGPVFLNRWFEHLCHLGESASSTGLGQQGLAVLEVIVPALCWINLEQHRSLKGNGQPQQLVVGEAEGNLIGKMTTQKEKQPQLTVLMISKYCLGMQKALTSLDRLWVG